MVIVKLMGGLGNQMFQYACGRSLAIRTNTPLKLDLTFLQDRSPKENLTFRDYDLNLLNIKENIASSDEVADFQLSGKNILQQLWQITQLHRRKKYYIKERLIKFYKDISRLAGSVYLDGYWQSETYFQDIERTLRQDFEFKNPLSPVAVPLAKEIAGTNAVSINIRLGDYLATPKVKNFYAVCEASYYNKAMDHIASVTQNPVFYVFTDQTIWVQSNLSKKYPVMIIGPEYAGKKFDQYLKLMSMCKHHIIPNSTFAWWGAWLNPSRDKIVVSPAKWIKQPGYGWYNSAINPAGWVTF